MKRAFAILVSVLAPIGALAQDASSAKADPAATKLLAEARAARAQWLEFPGFSAEIEVNLDGQLSRGKLHVSADAKVAVTDVDKTAQEWAKAILTSIVAHRISNSRERNSRSAFVDDNTSHPLGREIRILHDEFHSSYRIKDQQIMVVNRHMKNTRFTILVLENRKNKEGKYLPASYVVNYWHAKSGALSKSVANLQTWIRIGRFDLPASAQAITALPATSVGPGSGYSAKALRLTNHQLATSSAN